MPEAYSVTQSIKGKSCIIVVITVNIKFINLLLLILVALHQQKLCNILHNWAHWQETEIGRIYNRSPVQSRESWFQYVYISAIVNITITRLYLSYVANLLLLRDSMATADNSCHFKVEKHCLQCCTKNATT